MVLYDQELMPKPVVISLKVIRTVIGLANRASYTAIAQFIVLVICAAFGSVVIVLSQVGRMTRCVCAERATRGPRKARTTKSTAAAT